MQTKHLAIAMAGALAHTLVQADNGFFQVGYGAEARGVGGASAAVTREVLGGASNPATTIWINGAGERLEAGMAIIQGRTRMSRSTAAAPLLDTHTDSERAFEPVGEFAYGTLISPAMSVSVVAYANGASTFLPASTTACPGTLGNAMCGAGRTGVSIRQLIVAPSVSMKVASDVSLGASLLLVGQLFKAEGVQMLAASSQSPGRVSNQGTATAHGLGLRLGAYWRASEQLGLGASWSPRVRMSEFGKYRGLLADAGRFDAPENYLIGLSLAATPQLSLLADYQRINYKGVAALANRPFDGGNPFGSAGGAGNGWENMDVWKGGVRYQATPRLHLSAGLSYNTAAFASASTSANINSPSTFRRHYTLGAGYAGGGAQWSAYYLYAPQDTCSGPSALAAAMGSSGRESIGTRQQIIGLQYSHDY
ncbi:MAG: outer membrane protein transport protein [Janthinobacterium sp.]